MRVFFIFPCVKKEKSKSKSGIYLQAIVVFVITIHAYAYEKSEMEELGMVALSGCIWLQAFVVAQETKYSSLSLRLGYTHLDSYIALESA